MAAEALVIRPGEDTVAVVTENIRKANRFYAEAGKKRLRSLHCRIFLFIIKSL